MNVQTYVKRLRMERRLREPLSGPDAPAGFTLVPWDESLLITHAEVKWRSFRHTLDVCVFPKLGWYTGCLQLMEAIHAHAGFVPQATWLARGPTGYCGCIQGVFINGVGMIQNLGVLPDMRGRGLGRLLLLQAMRGFTEQHIATASLEVSDRNIRAVKLYYDLGFQIRKTLFRELHEPPEDYTI